MGIPENTVRLPEANARVAGVFDDLADLLEMNDENPFRVRAYRTAARELRSITRDVGGMVERQEDLTELRGIGEDLAQKIAEIVHTGHCAALDEMHVKLPASLHEILQIPGLGPKKVRHLFDRLGVRCLDDLSKAAKEHRIQGLPGFGAKSETKILDAIAGLFGTGRRMNLADVRVEADRIAGRLRALRGVKEVVVAGSYRRARASVGDLDVLACGSASSSVMRCLADDDHVQRVLAHGKARTTVVLRSGLQVDLRVFRPSSFGAALHYFTGSKDHNIAVRRLALKRGLKLNEYGVFRGKRRVAGATEAEVFACVDLPFIPPELRENRGEIEAAREGRLPRLVERGHLRGDMVWIPEFAHLPSVIAKLSSEATAEGLDYLLVVHELGSPTTSATSLRDRIHRTAQLLARVDLDVLQGLEIPIHGSPHFPADLLAAGDFTVARLEASRDATRCTPAALALIRKLEPAGLRLVFRELDRVSEPTADLGRILEEPSRLVRFIAVDGRPEQLLAAEPILRAARERDLLVALCSGDAEQRAFSLDLAVGQARRAWLEPAGVVNARDWTSLCELLRGPKTTRRRASG